MGTIDVRSPPQGERMKRGRSGPSPGRAARIARLGAGPLLAGVLALASPASARAGVTDEDILQDATHPSDVVTYGMGPHQHRFSPLSQITTQNVKHLVPAWSLSFGGEKQRGQEAQPLVYKGRIFVTASYSRLFAVDARTGAWRWHRRRERPAGRPLRAR